LDAGGVRGDLVVVALPGVQTFITEARSTSDVSAASRIYSALARRVVDVLGTDGLLILPARQDPPPGAPRTPDASASGRDGEDDDHSQDAEDDPTGLPNRIVALLPAGSGPAAARRASEAVHEAWQGWVRQVMRPARGDPLPQTPGFPRVQWVCVPQDPGGYEVQWRRAQRLLAGRRRVQDFAAVPEEEWRQRVLCSLTPRWPAERSAPPGVPPYEQRTPLSAVGWVKRRWHHMNEAGGFPSTASIASAPYRRAVLRHLADPQVLAAVRVLDQARQTVERALETSGRETRVPGLEPLIPDGGPGAWFGRSGGPWVYPERWRSETLAREADPARGGREKATQIESAVRYGHQAARLLRDLMAQSARQAPPLASYLAVVVQDLDSMGLFLSGRSAAASGQKIPIIPNEHGRVSRDLLLLSRRQTEALRAEKLLSVPVYAGGDDLLTFSPAATAIDAAQACHDLIPPTLPHASTAAASKSDASATVCPKAPTASATVRQSPPARPGSPPACAPSNAPAASPTSTTPPSRCPSPSDHFPLRARRPTGKLSWNRSQSRPIRRSASQLGRWSQPWWARPYRGVPLGQRELPGHGLTRSISLSASEPLGLPGGGSADG
jgi:CRISPR-associated protein Cmr2